MPDREAPISLAQHSFAGGEVAPGFYGRQDLQKYGSGCTIMRNWYIDPKGGTTIRPGTQFIGHPLSTGYCRLIPFQFSPDAGQSYILVFSNAQLIFVKNPGTPAYPNSSNAGFVQAGGGGTYSVGTPYSEADLRSLHFVQIADVMWLTCLGHPRYKLQRLADNNWTLTAITSVPTVAAPIMQSVSISPSPGGTPAPTVTTRYMYRVSAVDSNGVESLPSIPLISGAGINIGVTEGTVTVRWSPVTGAQYYKVWKALPGHADRIPLPHEQFGFVGYSYGVTFTDGNIVADFAKAPLRAGDPFAPGAITGYSISAAGTGYTPGSTTITVTDGTGTGAVVYPILDTNVAGTTGGIVGLYIDSPGSGYTAPTFTASGGTGFAATGTVGPSTGLDPSAVGLFQQRTVYGSTTNRPKVIIASRPGRPDDFRKTNPPVDDDAFELEIFDQQISRIYWFRSLPGGLLIGTNSGVMQLTGGTSTASNPVAVSASNAVIVPQTFFGSADIAPAVIDREVLYVQREGTVRDLQYNFYANIYAGNDLTVLSSHLFKNARIVDWAYADSPNKTDWAILDNGTLLSLCYLKSQEIAGWARHDTFGRYESIATVQEGTVNAVYFSVFRNGIRWIERQTQQQMDQVSDAWQLDGAISSVAHYPAADITLSGLTGTVAVVASANIFALGDIGKVINAGPYRGTVATYVAANQVTLTIDPTRPFGLNFIQKDFWRLDPVITSISGLGDHNGTVVYAVVDGIVQGPFTVSGGSITLTTPGSQVVVGYRFQAQLQPLYVEPPGEGTVQGKRKKVVAASIRVHNAKGLKYGSEFSNLTTWVENVSSTDQPAAMPYGALGLYSGDQRLWLNQEFGVGGWVCVQQDDPYPATVLLIVPEIAQGDTM
jgi:hypothetical protein